MTFHETTKRATIRWGVIPLLVVAGVAGCNSLTDLKETPQTFISPTQFYKNDAQAQYAVNAIYAPLMGWNGWKQPAQHSIMCDDDEVWCESWMGGGTNGQIAGQWYTEDNSVWFGDYQIIERANEVLENVPPSAGITATMKQTATGDAHFGRAYAYFDLVRRFGGVPLRTEAYKPDVQMGALPRSAPEVIWAQIVTDLRAATTELPTAFVASTGQGIPRRAAAWGLLAKVYMHMAGAEVAGTPLAANRNTYLDSAAYAARQVEADPTVSLEPQATYMNLFTPDVQDQSHEILFAVQGMRTNQGGSNVVPFFAPAGDCSLAGGCGPAGPGFITLREDFVDTFEPNDVRMKPDVATPWTWKAMPASQSQMGPATRTVIQFDSLKALGAAGLLVDTVQVKGDGWQDGGCAATRLWPGFYRVTLRSPSDPAVTTTDTIAIPHSHFTLKYVDRSNTGSEYGNGNNFIILRYADVLLLKAEAINERTGPTPEAIAAVNTIRTRAGLPDLTAAATADQASLREAIRTERAHELYAEFQRRFDMIRWGIYLDVMNAPVNSEFANNAVCHPRQAYQLLQPIPSRELAANPAIKENNPGY